MKIGFEGEMPTEIDGLEFRVVRETRPGVRCGQLVLYAYFKRDGRHFGLGTMIKSKDSVGVVAQALATSAAWTMELLEHPSGQPWPQEKWPCFAEVPDGCMPDLTGTVPQ